MSVEVPIGADIRPFGKSINQLEDQLRRFQGSLKESTDPKSIQRLNSAIDATKSRIQDINNFGKQGGSALTQMGVAGSAAASKMKTDYTGLARVIQDLPYGFNAIGNNLTELLPAAGGAGLAISAVVSAITFANIGFGAWTRGLTDNQDALGATKRMTDELNKSVNGLAGTAAGEAGKMMVLYEATQNVNIPLKDRNRIIDELQDKYPSYFGNLTNEQILAGKAARSYEALTASIINAAVARAGEEIIAQQVKKLAELTVSLNVAAAGMKHLNDAQREVMASGAGGFIVDEKGDLETISNYKANITTEIKEAQKAIRGMLSNFSAEVILGDFTGGKTEKAKKKKTPQEVLKQLDIDLATIRVTGRAAGDSYAKGIEESIGASQKAIGELLESGVGEKSSFVSKIEADIKRLRPVTEGLNVQMAGVAASVSTSAGAINAINIIPFEQGIANVVKNMGERLTEAQIQLQDFNANISSILQNGLVDTLAGVSEAIGVALGNGASVIDNVGQTLLQSLGRILAQLGEMAIATGIGIEGIRASLKSLNPAAAIAAGVGLLALAGVVKAKAAKIGNSMGSGVSGGDIALPGTGYTSPSFTSTASTSRVVSSGDTLAAGGVIRLIAKGPDLVAAMNRAGQQLAAYAI